MNIRIGETGLPRRASSSAGPSSAMKAASTSAVRTASLRVTDGPFAEAKEVIGGYFTIEAADYNEAVEICSDCPHLTYGGRIELREVEPT